MSIEGERSPRRRKVRVDGFRRLSAQGGRVAEVAADQIRHRIEAGELRTGERLPSERDLADELGISRAALRESLRSLEAIGYLHARVGQGRFVADVQDSGTELIGSWLTRNRDAIEELDEIRAALERQCLRGARETVPRRLGTELRGLLAMQAVAIGEGRGQEAARIDAVFHRRVSSLSPNGALRALTEAMIARAAPLADAVYRIGSFGAESLRQHERILDALEAGDLALAADQVWAHHRTRPTHYVRQEAAGLAATGWAVPPDAPGSAT